MRKVGSDCSKDGSVHACGFAHTAGPDRQLPSSYTPAQLGLAACSFVHCYSSCRGALEGTRLHTQKGLLPLCTATTYVGGSRGREGFLEDKFPSASTFNPISPSRPCAGCAHGPSRTAAMGLRYAADSSCGGEGMAERAVGCRHYLKNLEPSLLIDYFGLARILPRILPLPYGHPSTPCRSPQRCWICLPSTRLHRSSGH